MNEIVHIELFRTGKRAIISEIEMVIEKLQNDDKKKTIYFDGLCHLCSREINHYRGMRGSENLEFVDITSATFDAHKEGLDPRAVHKTMHLRNRDGRISTGVNAFISIWEELPALRFLVPIARFAPSHFILSGFYSLFAKVRPLLPRKSCDASPYCETPPRP